MAIRRGPTSFEDVLNDLRKDSKFRRAQRRVAPYFDLAIEVIKRRIELGLTQKDLAEIANTFQSRISKIESGEHDIRFSTLIDTKNILVPIEETEYQLNNNAFEYLSVANTVFQTQPYSEYSEAKEYQVA